MNKDIKSGTLKSPIHFVYPKYDDVDYDGISQRLWKLYTSTPLSHLDLAQDLNISRKGLYNAVRQESLGSLTTVSFFRLYERLGIDPFWVLFGYHTTLREILAALELSSEKAKYDVYVRLYAYHTGKQGLSVFCPKNSLLAADPFLGIAGYDGTYFCKSRNPNKPLTDAFLNTDAALDQELEWRTQEFLYPRCQEIDFDAFYKRLEILPDNMGLMKTEFYNILEISRVGWKKILYRKCAISLKQLHALHEKLGIDMQWLVFGSHTMHDDLLLGLQSSSEQVKLDVFVRLCTHFAKNDISISGISLHRLPSSKPSGEVVFVNDYPAAYTKGHNK